MIFSRHSPQVNAARQVYSEKDVVPKAAWTSPRVTFSFGSGICHIKSFLFPDRYRGTLLYNMDLAVAVRTFFQIALVYVSAVVAYCIGNVEREIVASFLGSHLEQLAVLCLRQMLVQVHMQRRAARKVLLCMVLRAF